jgi:hypothetical protein
VDLGLPGTQSLGKNLGQNEGGNTHDEEAADENQGEVFGIQVGEIHTDAQLNNEEHVRDHDNDYLMKIHSRIGSLACWV